MKRLDRYIENCFEEAAKKEKHILNPEDFDFRYYIFNNKSIAVVLNCKYSRVLKIVNGRLKRNIKKNFGYDMTNVIEYDADVQGYDPNYSVCEVIVKQKNGKNQHFFVSHIREEDFKNFNVPNQEAPYCLMIKLAKKKGIIDPESKDDGHEFRKKVSWKQLKKLWMEIYQETKFKNLNIITSSNVKILG